jgi:DNA recombination protein RmuC
METLLAPLLLVVGLGTGAAVAWWLRGREIAALRTAADRALAAERGAAEAAAAAREEGHQRELAQLAQLRGDIEGKLQALAADVLQRNQSSFLHLANEVFAKHREGAAATLAQRQQEIAALLTPISTHLDAYRKGLAEIEKAREAAYGGLSAEMQSLARLQADASAQTRRLVNALQAAPKTRGRWGEHQLHNVMELAGMSAYADFETEPVIDRDDGKLRPDVIIRLPGDRRIVVDAKTSMTAYLDAVEAVDDDARESCLVSHARQLRTHMKLLAGKQYWDALPCTPDFVAMFIPGENFYAAAIERDPQLFEDAIANRVLIVTPTTLIALAKAIAIGWRQEKIAENARQIGELGRELFRRLSTMGDHVGRLGAGLESAVKHYNNFVASLESRVLPQGRRFSELDLDLTTQKLPELKPVETQIRALRGDGDAGALIIPLLPGERLQPGE